MSSSLATTAAWTFGSRIVSQPIASAFIRAQTIYAPVEENDQSDTALIQQVGLRTSPWAQLKSAWSGRGVRGLFKGLYLRLPNLLLDSLVVAASSTYLRTSLPAFSSLLPLQHLLSIAYLPLRVLSTTIIVDPSSFDTWNPFEALRRLAAKEEGGLWSLWTSRRYLQAAAVELVADCATDAVDVLVKRFCRWIRISFSNETISGQRTFNLFGYLANTFGGIVLVSAGVALMGLAMSNIQSRLQVSSGAYLSSSTRTKADKASSVEASEKVFLRSRPYAGVWDCATSVVREEGWQALFRGVREFSWMGVGFAGVCAVAILGICFWREEALVYLHGKVDRAAKEKREGDVLGLSRFLRPVDYHRSLQQL